MPSTGVNPELREVPGLLSGAGAESRFRGGSFFGAGSGPKSAARLSGKGERYRGFREQEVCQNHEWSSFRYADPCCFSGNIGSGSETVCFSPAVWNLPHRWGGELLCCIWRGHWNRIQVPRRPARVCSDLLSCTAADPRAGQNNRTEVQEIHPKICRHAGSLAHGAESN